MIESLLSSGAEQLARLSADQYGNYVVQIALRLASAANQARLVGLLLPSLQMLAISKAGSNVAEAILGCSSAAQLAAARQLLREASTDLGAHCFGRHVMAALGRAEAKQPRS